MLSKRKKSVVHLFSAVQTGKLYSNTHPKFHDAIENAHNSLKEALENKTDLIDYFKGHNIEDLIG